MKQHKQFLSGILLLALVAACKKGDTGPAGPAGSPGQQGPAGPQGMAGNANVTVYTYGSRTFTGLQDYLIPNVTQAKIDSSMLLAYYNPSSESPTSWYPIPGLGSGGLYETRSLTYQSSSSPEQTTLSVRLVKPDGTGSYATAVTFTRLKIFLVPASVVVPLGRRQEGPGSGIPTPYPLYEEIKNYFSLSDN